MMQQSHQRLKILLCLGILLCFFGNVFAVSKKNVPSTSASQSRLSQHNLSEPGSVYYQLSVGTGVTSIGETTDLVLTDAITNRYVANKKDKMLVLFGAGIGYQFHLTHTDMGLGVAFYHIQWGHYGGVLHPAFNLNPAFDALNYAYRVSSSMLWAEQYWMLGHRHWKPYLFLGLGITWNNVFDYTETPVNPNSSAAPMSAPFHSSIHCYFSYGIGAGINYLLSNNKTQISMGYRYINLDNGQLGTTPLQTTTQRLSTGTLYAHLIVLSVFFK